MLRLTNVRRMSEAIENRFEANEESFGNKIGASSESTVADNDDLTELGDDRLERLAGSYRTVIEVRIT